MTGYSKNQSNIFNTTNTTINFDKIKKTKDKNTKYNINSKYNDGSKNSINTNDMSKMLNLQNYSSI